MNNFDQSSSGINLELSCFRDSGRSAMEFEESFRIIQYKGYKKNCIAVYTECGNVSDDFSFDDPNQYQFTVKEFQRAFARHYDKELSQHYFSKPFSKLTKAELVEFLECSTYDSSERAEFCQENFTPLYSVIVTRGYCQGDYAEVIITKQFKEWLKENGRTFEQSEADLKTTIDHLFWDAPIYCRLTINDDKEIFLDEWLADIYEWDKDKLIKDFTASPKDMFLKTDSSTFESLEQIEYVVKWLENALPENPEYQQ